jgi:hypothetical protein
MFGECLDSLRMGFDPAEVEVNVSDEVSILTVFPRVGYERALAYSADFRADVHSVTAFPKFQEVFSWQWNDWLHDYSFLKVQEHALRQRCCPCRLNRL